MTSRALIDRWGLTVLLGGDRPHGKDCEEFQGYLLGEREYLSFLRAIESGERVPSIVRLVEEVQRLQHGSGAICSVIGTLLSVSQVSEIHGIPLSIARLPADAVGLLPVVSDQFGLTDAAAETLLLARMWQVPIVTCYRVTHPRLWKALYLYRVPKMDLDHQCPSVVTPSSWYQAT